MKRRWVRCNVVSVVRILMLLATFLFIPPLNHSIPVPLAKHVKVSRLGDSMGESAVRRSPSRVRACFSGNTPGPGVSGCGTGLPQEPMPSRWSSSLRSLGHAERLPCR